jgi:hypothetical protein
VVNVGGSVVHQLHVPVNAVLVLYTTHVARNHANVSVLVPVAVAEIFLRLLFASVNMIVVGVVESI